MHTDSIEKLERWFHAPMLNIGRETKKFGYNPVRFDQMVHDTGGLRTAQRLLRDQTIPAGLIRLWEEGRLDLSMEALVLKEPWCVLFTDAELKEARRRLRELDYVVEHTRMEGEIAYGVEPARVDRDPDMICPHCETGTTDLPP